jgi:hypothetical protein
MTKNKLCSFFTTTVIYIIIVEDMNHNPEQIEN